MNIFKKIGAALLAAAMSATMAITASADEGRSSGKGITAKVDRQDAGTMVTISNIPSGYAECDSVYADIQFTTLTRVNGEVTFPGYNRYSLRARQDKGGVIGAWVIYDSQTGEWQGANDGGSGMAGYAASSNTYLIGLESGNKYFEDSFTEFNAVYVEIYGITNNERVNYTQSGELTQERQAFLCVVGEVEDITDTSQPGTSEPASSDTSSEPTSSDTSSESTSSDASSEPTTSDTSSEPTSSETSSEPTSSGNSESTPGDNDNPNSGAVMLFIPLMIVGGAAVAVSSKKRK